MSGRIALVVLASLVPFVQLRVDAALGRLRAQDDALYLWSGQQVRRLVPGLEGLAADIYWLRTVQYFGGQRAFASRRNFDLLKPLIEITVTLDPRMEIAYRYGAVFLAEPEPAGAGKPREAIALLERGVEALPANWRLRQDLGFFHFLFLNDAKQASRILLEASEIEGAPAWLENLAADVLAKGGLRETARSIWRRILEQSDGQMKHNAQVQLLMLDALDEAERLTQLVEGFTRRAGRRPASLEELVREGWLRHPPVDAANVPFEFDAPSGTVRISRRSSLWRPLH